MKYDKEETNRLANLMRQTVHPDCDTAVDYDEIGKSWRSGIAREFWKKLVSDMTMALERGADPNPIPGKSLLAVLYTCPLEKSKELIECIKTAIALGTNVKTPLQYDCVPQNYKSGMDRDGYTIIRSPLSETSSVYIRDEEFERRINAIFSKMSDVDMQSVLCPVPPSGANKVCVVEPLLCEGWGGTRFDMLMKHVEKIKNPAIRESIVNAPIEVSDGTRTFAFDETHAWALRNKVDFTLYPRLGNTAAHTRIITSNSDTSVPEHLKKEIVLGFLKKLAECGADLTVKNTNGLTPYGMACIKGLKNVLASGLFDPDPSSEFSNRDRLGMLLPAFVLNNMDTRDINEQNLNAVETMLSEYKKCRHLDDRFQTEITETLSYTVARIALHNIKAMRNVKTSDVLALVQKLFDAGADPNYALPGELPLWQKTMLTFGDSPISNLLVKNVPDPTGTVREWAAHYGIEYVSEEPQETEVKR